MILESSGNKRILNVCIFQFHRFNAIPSTTNAVTSAIGRYASQDLETRQVFKNEAATVIQNGLDMISINKLNNLENFILEVKIFFINYRINKRVIPDHPKKGFPSLKAS